MGGWQGSPVAHGKTNSFSEGLAPNSHVQALPLSSIFPSPGDLSDPPRLQPTQLLATGVLPICPLGSVAGDTALAQVHLCSLRNGPCSPSGCRLRQHQQHQDEWVPGLFEAPGTQLSRFLSVRLAPVQEQQGLGCLLWRLGAEAMALLQARLACYLPCGVLRAHLDPFLLF